MPGGATLMSPDMKICVATWLSAMREWRTMRGSSGQTIR
jgi:hypothetical protein